MGSIWKLNLRKETETEKEGSRLRQGQRFLLSIWKLNLRKETETKKFPSHRCSQASCCSRHLEIKSPQGDVAIL